MKDKALDCVVGRAVEIFNSNEIDEESGYAMTDAYAFGNAVEEIVKTNGLAFQLLSEIYSSGLFASANFLQGEGNDLREFLCSMLCNSAVSEPLARVLVRPHLRDYDREVVRRRALAIAHED